MPRPGKCSFAAIVAACALAPAALSLHAQQAYPSKPIRIIIPNPPGGGVTVMGRLFGQQFTEAWGQQVIVDNRAGGNGFIGGEALARSQPDGHTMEVITTVHIVTPLLFPPPYDPIRDFTPIATASVAELVMLVHPSVQANSLREFIALAKEKPRQLNYGSSGPGSVTRLAGAYFDMMAGTTMQNVSYKGTGPAMIDLLGGQVQLFFAVPSAGIPHTVSGKVKALAVSGRARLPGLPQVPTFEEAGMRGFDVSTWYGFIGPAGMPRGIVDKLAAQIARILALPDVKEKLAAQGFDPFFTPPQQFAALMRSDTAKYAKIIKTANIKGDE